MLVLLLGAVVVVEFAPQRSSRVPPHILLVVWDTVRADHVAVTTNQNVAGRDTTPYLRTLAEKGVVFPEVRANANWTLPSHASLFTGRLPSEHGCHFEHRWLADENVTIAEILSAKAGYFTAAFSANPNVSRTFNLLQGFRDVYEAASDRDIAAGKSASDAVEDHVVEWVAAKRPRTPCFLFVNFMDAHLPYDAAHGFEKKFGAAGAALDRGALAGHEFFDRVVTGEQPLDATFVAALAERYDDAIAGLDARLARLLERLPQDFREHLVVIVTSDHGEDLGDHGLVDHQGGLHETLLRVPLVIEGAGVPSGKTADAAITLADLQHVVQDLANGEFQVPGAGHRPLFAERMVPVAVLDRLAARVPSLPQPARERLAVLARREDALVIAGEPWKLVHSEAADGSGASDELFRIGPTVTDETKAETNDASQRDQLVAARTALLAGRRIVRESLVPDVRVDADGTPDASLAQLGYGGAAGPTDAKSLTVHAAQHFTAGNRAFAAGDLTSAEREYRAAVALAPDSADAHFNLALTLGKLGQSGERQEWETFLEVADPAHDAPSIDQARRRLAELSAAKTSK